MGILLRRDWYVRIEWPFSTGQMLIFLPSYYDGYGTRRCSSPWSDWGRWVAFAVIVGGAFLIFLLIAYVLTYSVTMIPESFWLTVSPPIQLRVCSTTSQKGPFTIPRHCLACSAATVWPSLPGTATVFAGSSRSLWPKPGILRWPTERG